MKEQNFSNHSRLVPSFHGLTLLPLLILLASAIRNIVISDKDDLYNESLILLTVLVLASLYYHTRTFALKAQDRAIRAEENLRHFALTGKLLDPKLRIAQIVALRFASDSEFPQLAKKSAEEGLSKREIKKAIRDWKADHYRV